jgi:hypothetical protein
MLGDEMTAGAI